MKPILSARDLSSRLGVSLARLREIADDIKPFYKVRPLVDKKDKLHRQFLPKGHKIYDASALVEPEQKESLKLNAPRKEGDYEYVCTFPGHGILMWGVLVVAKDVEGYLAEHPTFMLPAPGAPVGK